MDKFKDTTIAAINAVIAQGAQSKNDTECAYKGYDGLKCLVGHMIQDCYYHPELESKDISNADVVDAVEQSLGTCLNHKDLRILNNLQRAHDMPCYPTHFLDKFKERIIQYTKQNELPEWCITWE